MKPYIQYLNYVVRHKWYVFLECVKLGIPWRGITHDLSKFRPSEFFPYAAHFYGYKKEITETRDKTGYYKPTDTGDPAFDKAWHYHAHRNRHHWQWHLQPTEDIANKVFEMEADDITEMVADWRGAGKAQGFATVKEWYKQNKNRMVFGPNTRREVEALLAKLGELDES